MSIKRNLNLISLQFILLFIIYSYNPIMCDYCKCPEGFLAIDYVYCPTPMFCPDLMLKINAYSCAFKAIFPLPSKCKSGLECWNGECVNSSDELFTSCPSHISCPFNKIKCSDNTCVTYSEDCPHYLECPPFNPIKCPNGDCRKKLEDCPSLIHCPDTYPILCNDGSCRKIKSQCEFPSENTSCFDEKRIRCSDGTCANSQLLCPTLVTCPSGYEKCWNGICMPKGTCFQDYDEQIQKCDVEKEILCQLIFHVLQI